MPSYISAYDTEAVYAWWDAPTESGYQGRISYEGERLAECIAGVRAVAQVHLERQAPASFFIVAELLQCTPRPNFAPSSTSPFSTSNAIRSPTKT